eukprot:1017189-Prorocentrum_minimum.AAC.1
MRSATFDRTSSLTYSITKSSCKVRGALGGQKGGMRSATFGRIKTPTGPQHRLQTASRKGSLVKRRRQKWASTPTTDRLKKG